MAYAHTHTANPHWLPPRQGQEIDYVPGRDGWPLVGTTLEQLKDPHAFTARMAAEFGPIYRTNSFGGRFVQLLGPEANELVLFDRDKIFSSEQGWGPVLNLVFPRGLMLMDFEKHRGDRRTLSVAFKPEPMKLYADALNKGIAARVAVAAHDTITSSATSMTMLLARHPEWQDRLRAEMAGLGINDEDLPFDRLGDLVLTDYAFKEALRMIPPVPSLPRRAIKPFSFGGYDFPAGTYVGIQPAYTHMMKEYWPDPETFDPLRFEPEQVKARHKYAWVPFGGGAHMCLGLHFAYMQIKILMWHMLRTHRIEIGEGSGEKWQAWPIPKPRDGLPVTLAPLDG